MKNDKGRTLGNRSTKRTIEVLQLISKNNGDYTLTDISSALDIPVSSAADILKTLLEKDVVQYKDARLKSYAIGPMAYYIGSSYIRHNSLLDVARDIADELSLNLMKTVFIGKPTDTRIVYIYKREAQELVVATCELGASNDLYCTALGKSILAYDNKLTERVLSMPMKQKTKHTITDPQALREDLEKVRERGYAIDNLEQNDYLICMAAPIFDNTGRPVAAISSTSFHKLPIDFDKESALIMDAAKRISAGLGHI